MPATPPDTATARTLLDHHRQGSTGRVTVGAGGGEVAVQLLDGHVIGSSAGDDTRHLIERFQREGHLTGTRARQLNAMVNTALPILGRQAHDPVLGLLTDEVDPTVFEEAMRQRFRENLCRFLAHRSTPRFVRDTPWTENIVVGHETGALLDEASRQVQLAAGLRDDLPVGPGPSSGEAELDGIARRLAAEADTTAGRIVESLHLELTAARAAVVDMLERGVLTARDAGRPRRRRRRERHPFPDDPSHNVPEEELDAFSGELDRTRGGSQGGRFVTQRHNLDRVELHDTDDGPEATFSAPTLGERDAMAKVDVANEVLGTLSRAIDRSAGRQRGAAFIQLLVDGRPRRFTPLYEGIKVTSAGCLPSRAILANLRRRPAAEQRRLLNPGLLDLLDRALDRASDELPDALFDDILEHVMGYRQRLGL